MKACLPVCAYTKCWNGWSPLAHQRQEFVRCDAHWHRPKRADWRAKAYQRAAVNPCSEVSKWEREQRKPRLVWS